MKNKINLVAASFLPAVLLSAFAVISFKYYITFSNEAAGSYAIATVLGSPLKMFLIKVLLLATGIIVPFTFILKSSRKAQNKVLFPGFITAMGALWLILPLISSYTISRFSGNLTTQSVAGIAIIANVVFMMVSVCCAVIAAVDTVHSLAINVSAKEDRANILAVFLSGLPTGIGIALFVTPMIISSFGLSYAFAIFGGLSLAAGIYMIAAKPLKYAD